MKKISLEKIHQKHPQKTYLELYDYILKHMEAGDIKPVKKSGTNGKKPALFLEYWIAEEKKKRPDHLYIEELNFQLSPLLSNDYYLSHLERYEQDRKWVLLLDSFIKKHRDRIQIPVSLNERSFEIWHREKFLQKEQGKKILKRCGMELQDLNLYETTEPLAYYVQNRETPQNLLIVENKDTFYSMRKHLLSGSQKILDLEAGTLIYGAGKGILRSFRDFVFCVEPYMQEESNQIYYFGDLDYEGIGIYENLAQLFAASKEIIPFIQAYEMMLDKSKQIVRLPETREQQNRNISSLFFSYFTAEQVHAMKNILEQELYIPQEILSISDF